MSHVLPPPVSVPSLSSAQNIKRYFLTCPTLQEVAVTVLQRSLGVRYRWLTIDRDQPVVMEPVYRYDGKRFVLLGHNSLTLVDALIERCASGIFADYNQGQILAVGPGDGSPEPLHVKTRDLEAVINEEGATLIERYQEALVHYWMGPADYFKARYLWLADALKDALFAASREPAITHEQLDMVMSIMSQPAPGPQGQGVQAYLVDQLGEAGAVNLEILRGLVLVKRYREGETVLLFTLARGIQAFGSLGELGAWLPNLLTPIAAGHHLQWRLYQPKGNIFYSFSLTFLAKQLADIGVALPGVRAFNNQNRLLERTLRVISSDFDASPIHSSQLIRLRDALPRWLLQADTALQMEMSQYAIDLAKVLRQPGWKPFDEGIPSLAEFARKALLAQFAKDFAQNTVPDPDHIILTMAVDEPAPQAQGKTFWALPPLYTHSRWTLTEFAWLFMPGLDPKQLLLEPPAAGETGTTLSAEALVGLVERANVRGAYGQLISAKLQQDPAEVSWRQARFSEQLRIQLPMLALEYHLKYPQAFSRQAYSQVVAVLKPEAQRKVQGQTIVLRPLAFQLEQEAVADAVINMFIIGPRDVKAGPHILYRPLAEVKLIEFANWAALLAAMTRAGPLQYQVMAWMPAAIRSRYLAPGLAVPGLAAFEVVDFNDSLWANTALKLAEYTLEGDYLEQLFSSMVQAMQVLGDPQPLSGSYCQIWCMSRSGGIPI
ncbi:MAG: hypothetical protein GAK37_02329 [Pseudomonas sp.]|nr:MAG: hypothetical protein GAK37_02329 [Pseudomonas sp.]